MVIIATNGRGLMLFEQFELVIFVKLYSDRTVSKYLVKLFILIFLLCKAKYVIPLNKENVKYV